MKIFSQIELIIILFIFFSIQIQLIKSNTSPNNLINMVYEDYLYNIKRITETFKETFKDDNYSVNCQEVIKSTLEELIMSIDEVLGEK